MKPIIFESLFRLMGGKRSKDRNEPSFKRSDSFKRISIRKNYLERGNKGRNPLSPKRKAVPQAPPPVIEEEIVVSKPKDTTHRSNNSYNHSTNKSNTSDSIKSDPPVIDYEQWIKSINEDCKEKEKQLKAEAAQKSRKKSVEDLTRTDSAISISLGRIWMDAPLAPRSLELPRPSSSSVELNPNGRRVHHSLESALKERCHNIKPVERVVNKELSCSKDSGFSLSISIPRLSEVKPVGIFRKNVYMRDRENRRFLCSANKKRYSSDLYQVVVGRTPRSLKSLKLDPMIFVPPEKRKTIFTNTNTVKRRLAVQEIRDYSCPKDFQLIPDDNQVDIKPKDDDDDELSDEEDLYESISELSSSYKSSDDEDYVRRKAVKRKKSQRRNLKVLAKPNIHRAPSTLIKNRRLLKKPGECCYLLLNNSISCIIYYLSEVSSLFPSLS